MKKKTRTHRDTHLHDKIIISGNCSNCLMVDQYVTFLLLFSEAGLERSPLFCCNNLFFFAATLKNYKLCLLKLN